MHVTVDTEATGKNGKSDHDRGRADRGPRPAAVISEKVRRDPPPRAGADAPTVGLVANERPMNNVMFEKSRLRRLCAYT